MFQIQIVTTEASKGVFVCQFCDENDPAITARFTHPTLWALKVHAVRLVISQTSDIQTQGEQLERVDQLFNRVANRVCQTSDPALTSA